MSKGWNSLISNDDHLWKTLCIRHGFTTTRRSSELPDYFSGISTVAAGFAKSADCDAAAAVNGVESKDASNACNFEEASLAAALLQGCCLGKESQSCVETPPSTDTVAASLPFCSKKCSEVTESGTVSSEIELCNMSSARTRTDRGAFGETIEGCVLTESYKELFLRVRAYVAGLATDISLEYKYCSMFEQDITAIYHHKGMIAASKEWGDQ